MSHRHFRLEMPVVSEPLRGAVDMTGTFASHSGQSSFELPLNCVQFYPKIGKVELVVDRHADCCHGCFALGRDLSGRRRRSWQIRKIKRTLFVSDAGLHWAMKLRLHIKGKSFSMKSATLSQQSSTRS